MKELFNIQRFKFYAWVGLAFACLGTFHFASTHPGQFLESLFNNLWVAAYVTVANFLFFEYTLPRLSTKKIISSIGYILAHIFLWSWGLYLWRLIGIQVHVFTLLSDPETISKAVSGRMTYSVESLLFFTIIRHVYNHIKLRQATQQLRIEKQEAELNYLRSQTNPHFLFNTLNNIYSLTRDKSDLAPESILRLSQILRFMLYETGGDYIAVEQELKIITDYIALEKLRYDESLRVNFNYDVEDMKQAVPPLLLVPLVENAFKHGVSETRDQPFIDIHLSVRNRQLLFTVKNSSEVTQTSFVKENIGLSNLRRQLELLYKEYDLSVRQNGAVFIAALKINLASHV